MKISNRKYEHLKIATKYPKQDSYTGFEDVLLVHEALSNFNFSDVDTSIFFIKENISMPLLISSMTGGFKEAEKVNRRLAEAAQRNLIPIGVGSIRAAIEEKKFIKSYSIVREVAPDVPVISNIGIQQLVKGGVSLAEEAVELINADALAIHLNKLQELIMPEGEPNQSGAVEVLREVIRKLKVKVIIKETGCGISKEVALLASHLKINYVDVGGSGGTNFAVIEGIRAKKIRDVEKLELSKKFSSWGIPTAISVLEAKSVGGIEVIASGGIRNGLEVAKSIVLGSCCAGVARPLLEAAIKGPKFLEKTINRFKNELTATMFLVGARSVEELKTKPYVLTGTVRDWVIQRKLTQS
ncbi:MAG: type 2 isopentenyl-diphosphate Delta-isomerase [Thaumarchaeota archaeon]|jgi:isopentenyl-diphosphate delta-isomerase|nr:type 2 isopentenyl-diphosphate Delta-isomerase [Nitrososphaerota archaeon]